MAWRLLVVGLWCLRAVQVGDWLSRGGRERPGVRRGGARRYLGLERVPSQICATAFHTGRAQGTEGPLRREAASRDGVAVPRAPPPQR